MTCNTLLEAQKLLKSTIPLVVTVIGKKGSTYVSLFGVERIQDSGVLICYEKDNCI